ncbi:MAG: diacylglycerol/lipid kinase family protein, partial [Conexibacter sp.]
AWRALTDARIVRHRQVSSFSGAHHAHVRSLDDRPLPLQVDGDYLGEFPQLDVRVDPGALRVVS